MIAVNGTFGRMKANGTFKRVKAIGQLMTRQCRNHCQAGDGHCKYCPASVPEPRQDGRNRDDHSNAGDIAGVTEQRFDERLQATAARVRRTSGTDA